jgi:hypothetical protein
MLPRISAQAAPSGARPAPCLVGSLAAIALAALGLAACGTPGSENIGSGGMSCVDDSHACVSARGTALASLMNDKSRSWVRQPAPAAAYASGVRLFAFKQRKREMTCEELAIGKREADAGPGVLRGPAGRGLTHGQVARGVILAGEVSTELAREMKRRCRR